MKPLICFCLLLCAGLATADEYQFYTLENDFLNVVRWNKKDKKKITEDLTQRLLRLTKDKQAAKFTKEISQLRKDIAAFKAGKTIFYPSLMPQYDSRRIGLFGNGEIEGAADGGYHIKYSHSGFVDRPRYYLSAGNNGWRVTADYQTTAKQFHSKTYRGKILTTEKYTEGQMINGLWRYIGKPDGTATFEPFEETPELLKLVKTIK